MSSYSQFFGSGGGGGGTPINSFQVFDFSGDQDNPPGWNPRQKLFISPTSGEYYLETGTQVIDSGSNYPAATINYQFDNDPNRAITNYTAQVPSIGNFVVDDAGSIYMRTTWTPGQTSAVLYKYQATSPYGYTGQSLDTYNQIGPGTAYPQNNQQCTGQFFYSGNTSGPSGGHIVAGYTFGGTLDTTTGPFGTYAQGPAPIWNALTVVGYANIGQKEEMYIRFRGAVPSQPGGSFYGERANSTLTFSTIANSPGTGNYQNYDNVFGADPNKYYAPAGTTINDLGTKAATTGSFAGVPANVPGALGPTGIQHMDGHKNDNYFWAVVNNTASLMEPFSVIGYAQNKTDASTGENMYLRIK